MANNNFMDFSDNILVFLDETRFLGGFKNLQFLRTFSLNHGVLVLLSTG